MDKQRAEELWNARAAQNTVQPTPEEDRYVRGIWEMLPGSSCWMDAFHLIRRGEIVVGHCIGGCGDMDVPKSVMEGGHCPVCTRGLDAVLCVHACEEKATRHCHHGPCCEDCAATSCAPPLALYEPAIEYAPEPESFGAQVGALRAGPDPDDLLVYQHAKKEGEP